MAAHVCVATAVPAETEAHGLALAFLLEFLATGCKPNERRRLKDQRKAYIVAGRADNDPVDGTRVRHSAVRPRESPAGAMAYFNIAHGGRAAGGERRAGAGSWEPGGGWVAGGGQTRMNLE